jgi:hypothetical protein
MLELLPSLSPGSIALVEVVELAPGPLMELLILPLL